MGFGQKKYKRIIKSIYPEHNDGKDQDNCQLQGHNFNKLISYCHINPARLTQIGEYLEKRINKDLYKRRYGFVAVGMKIFNELLIGMKHNLSLFALPVMNVMKTLLAQPDLSLKRLATDTFIAFAKATQNDATNYDLDPCIHHFLQLASNENPDLAVRRDFRLEGLRGLNAYISRVEDISAFVRRYVEGSGALTTAPLSARRETRAASVSVLTPTPRTTTISSSGDSTASATGSDINILAVLLDNMQFPKLKAGYDEAPAGSSTDQRKEIEHVSTVATACLKALTGRANNLTIKPLLTGMLNFFDTHRSWHAMPLGAEAVDKHHIVIEALRSIQPVHDPIAVAMLLAHLDHNTALPAIAASAPPPAVVTALMGLIRGNIGPVSEVLAALLGHLVKACRQVDTAEAAANTNSTATTATANDNETEQSGSVIRVRASTSAQPAEKGNLRDRAQTQGPVPRLNLASVGAAGGPGPMSPGGSLKGPSLAELIVQCIGLISTRCIGEISQRFDAIGYVVDKLAISGKSDGRGTANAQSGGFGFGNSAANVLSTSLLSPSSNADEIPTPMARRMLIQAALRLAEPLRVETAGAGTRPSAVSITATLGTGLRAYPTALITALLKLSEDDVDAALRATALQVVECIVLRPLRAASLLEVPAAAAVATTTTGGRERRRSLLGDSVNATVTAAEAAAVASLRASIVRHALLPSNQPKNYRCLGNALVSLFRKFRLRELEYSIPLVFRLERDAARLAAVSLSTAATTGVSNPNEHQDSISSLLTATSSANGVTAAPLPRHIVKSVQALVAMYLLFIAKQLESTQLEEYVATVTAKRREAGQLCPYLVLNVADATLSVAKDQYEPDTAGPSPFSEWLLFDRHKVVEILCKIQLLHQEYKNLKDVLMRKFNRETGVPHQSSSERLAVDGTAPTPADAAAGGSAPLGTSTSSSSGGAENPRKKTLGRSRFVTDASSFESSRLLAVGTAEALRDVAPPISASTLKRVLNPPIEESSSPLAGSKKNAISAKMRTQGLAYDTVAASCMSHAYEAGHKLNKVVQATATVGAATKTPVAQSGYLFVPPTLLDMEFGEVEVMI